MTTEAFQQQAGELRKQLVSIAHKYMGNTDEAEDIAQDAMVKLWLMREQLTLPIAGMASIITRNLCIDALRKKHQTIDIAQLPDEADFSDDGEQIEQLLKVIDSLPSTQRTILRMRHLHIVVGISMTVIHFAKLETSDECVAYIYGKKYTDKQTVMAEMKQSLGNIADDDTQDEIEQQLNDLFRN